MSSSIKALLACAIYVFGVAVVTAIIAQLIFGTWVTGTIIAIAFSMLYVSGIYANAYSYYVTKELANINLSKPT